MFRDQGLGLRGLLLSLLVRESGYSSIVDVDTVDTKFRRNPISNMVL